MLALRLRRNRAAQLPLHPLQPRDSDWGRGARKAGQPAHCCLLPMTRCAQIGSKEEFKNHCRALTYKMLEKEKGNIKFRKEVGRGNAAALLPAADRAASRGGGLADSQRRAARLPRPRGRAGKAGSAHAPTRKRARGRLSRPPGATCRLVSRADGDEDSEVRQLKVQEGEAGLLGKWQHRPSSRTDSTETIPVLSAPPRPPGLPHPLLPAAWRLSAGELATAMCPRHHPTRPPPPCEPRPRKPASYCLGSFASLASRLLHTHPSLCAQVKISAQHGMAAGERPFVPTSMIGI